MDIAIVGFGDIAEHGHLPFYQNSSRIRVKAVVDPVMARCELAQMLIPHVQAFSNMEEMLAQVSVDTVDICSPPMLHVPAIREALSAGVHVLCEKPLACRATEVTSLMEKAMSHCRVIYPCHTLRFAPAIQYIRELITQGYIGELKTLAFRVLRRSHARGVIEWMPDWRQNREIAGGGILVDHGTHLIYLACYILQRGPIRVSASLSTNGRPVCVADRMVEDTATVNLDFGVSQVQLYVSWAAESRSWSLAAEGTEGTMRFSQDTRLEVQRDNSVQCHTIPSTFNDSSHHALYGTMFGDFELVVNSKTARHPVMLEALTAAEVLEKAYSSSCNGGRWEPIREMSYNRQ